MSIHRIFEARDTVGLSSTQVLLKPDVFENNTLIKEYIYCISEKTLIRINEKKILFLPFLNDEKMDREYLINNKVILIKKINKEFYGYFKIKDVINNNLEDNKEYSKLIKEYNLCEIENLCFLEYNKINVFEHKILFKNILNNEIKLPKMNNYNLCEFNCSKIIAIINNNISKIKNIKLEEDNLIIEGDNLKIEEDNLLIEGDNLKIESDNLKIEGDNLKIEEDNPIIEGNNIYFNIPILWIPCIKLKKYIKINKISKPTIKIHYKTCINCEVNNNNRFDIDFDNKILFNSCLDKEELNSIIKSYSYAERYFNKQTIINSYQYEKNKINIISIKEDYVLNKYDDCLFIIF